MENKVPVVAVCGYQAKPRAAKVQERASNTAQKYLRVLSMMSGRMEAEERLAFVRGSNVETRPEGADEVGSQVPVGVRSEGSSSKRLARLEW